MGQGRHPLQRRRTGLHRDRGHPVAFRNGRSCRPRALKRIRGTRVGDPGDIAALVAFLLSEEGEWINGQVINIDGGTVLRDAHDSRASRSRRRDGDERRRELCDAAIQVLAEQGSRGLTHEQVDRCAEVPDGTTSYYYRTRAALLRGVGTRVAEIDVANLQSVIDEPLDPLPFAHLRELAMMQADGPGLMLNRARHELVLGAVRDPGLAETSQTFVARINAMAHDAIAHLQPGIGDPALLDAQTTAVTTFIAGVFTRLVGGDRTISERRATHRTAGGRRDRGVAAAGISIAAKSHVQSSDRP